MIDAALTLWGKASPSRSSGPPFHPLVYHCLDVAAVFETLLDLPRFALPLERLFGAPRGHFAPALKVLVALHDIGKACIPFQAKAPHVWRGRYGVYPGPPAAFDHAAGAEEILRDRLRDKLDFLWPDWSNSARRALISSIAYHHGKPVDRAGGGSLVHTSASLSPRELAAINETVDAILSAFAPAPEPLPVLMSEGAKRLSWVLNGVVTLADWIGSSETVFHYEAPDLTPHEYWTTVARPRARDALKAAGLREARISPRTGLSALAGEDFSPSPAQRFAETVLLPSGACLFLLEDMTGSGKTEAALILAHRMMLAGLGGAIYVALPTMATANAMFTRMQNCYQHMFADDASPSLALAHGASALNEAFARSIVRIGAQEADYGDGDGETASSACSAFFADDRRKTFFAEAGVGTIDQAILSVLPSKHATMRQAGLARSILIVDEAHAYDAYVTREIERLLEFHAAAGGCAIILSATLPARFKRAYARAFCGRDVFESEPASTAYPLATIAAADAPLRQQAVDLRDGLARSVAVRRLESPQAALERICAAAAEGAAVAYIRNTVDDAQEAYEAVAALGLDAILFHARYAMCDRLAKEQEVLEVFGPQRNPDKRRRRVLIATQVAEQSLDLDFDLMISDLAPIDLLVQRAGRLWRHARADRPLTSCEFLVVSPKPIPDADAKWFARLFPRGQYVYPDAGLLWLSAKVLFETGEIRSPDGIRPLIEGVYGEGAAARVPDALQPASEKAEGKQNAERSHANANLLELSAGYSRGHQGWSSDMLTPTRLGEEQTLVRLAVWDGERIRPYADEADPQRAWAMSEARVRRSLAVKRGDYPAAIDKAARRLEEDWEKHGDRALVLPLLGEEPKQALAVGARGKDEKEEPVELVYDRSGGLRRRKIT